MSTIRFKTFSGSFSRYWNENLFFFSIFFLVEIWFKNDISIHRICPQSVLKHSVDHSQGIGMKIYFFFDFFLVEIWFKNDISIHRICPQSGLKHSVDHFQGIGMNIMHIVMVIYLTHQWLLRLDFIRFSHLSFLVLSTGPPSCPCFTIVSLPLWICMWFPRCLSWL